MPRKKEEHHPGLEGELQGGDPSELEATERGLPEEENPHDLDSGAEQPPDGLDPTRFDLAHSTKSKRHTAGGAGADAPLVIRSGIAKGLSAISTKTPPQAYADVLLSALVRVALGHQCTADFNILQAYLDQQEIVNADN